MEKNALADVFLVPTNLLLMNAHIHMANPTKNSVLFLHRQTLSETIYSAPAVQTLSDIVENTFTRNDSLLVHVANLMNFVILCDMFVSKKHISY
jgi:hypothetical protein